jgi:DNA (cytosine-5)-methyltransferase 1
MKHLGNITQINGAEIEPVDIITFGSPCQNLSVAGKQEGLKGEQSCLFYEAIRIIREMRRETNGRYPRYAIWENVPGAFSSNKRQDFRAVLEEITQAEIPMPKSGRWANAGMVRGNGYSVAWRVLDAQYWGVPQRRRRIFLVADFRGQSAPEILFECEGMSGDITESGKEGQGTAAGIGEGVTCPRDGVQGQSGTVEQFMFENHSQDTRYKGPLEVAQPVTATYGMGGNNQPFVVKATRKDATDLVAFACNQRDEVRDMKDKSGALQAQPGMKQQTFVLQSSMVGRAGAEPSEKVFPTLGATTQGDQFPHVAVAPFNTGQITSPQNGNKVEFGLPCHTLSANEHPPSAIISYGIQGSMIDRADKNGPQGNGINQEVSFTLNTTDRHAVANQGDNYSVRRLTPLECLRLQGFPDDWLDIDGMSDTQKYKAIGNSLAVPCVEFIMQRIKDVK